MTEMLEWQESNL